MGAVKVAVLRLRKQLELGGKREELKSTLTPCERRAPWGSVSSSVKYMFWVSPVSENKASQFPIWLSVSCVFFFKTRCQISRSLKPGRTRESPPHALPKEETLHTKSTNTFKLKCQEEVGHRRGASLRTPSPSRQPCALVLTEWRD